MGSYYAALPALLMMRIAILAQFPIHLLPGFTRLGEPKQHYATWLPQLAESFADTSDAEIHWVTLTTEVREPTVVRHLGQVFHLLPTATSKRASTLFRRDRAAISEVLARIKPDLVHGWGNEDVMGLAAVTSGFRNIVSVQGLLSHYVLRNKFPARTYFQAAMELFVINRADQLVCESLWSKEMTQKRLVQKNTPVHWVEYGVQKCFFDGNWNPKQKSPAAIYCGAVEPRKGIQDLVKAFQDPRLANFELVVVGTDTTKFAKNLKTKASKNIRWTGRLPIRESMKLMSEAWCFVLPTRGDTGPMAVKEAMVMGLPTISSPASGARDYISDGGNGFLVEPGDVNLLTDRLTTLLSDLSKCRAMGACRHEEARQHFNSARTADMLMEIYRKTA